jgi:hypothetical protein
MTSAQPWTDAQINAYALTHIALPGAVIVVVVLLMDRFVFRPKIRQEDEAHARREAARRTEERAQATLFRKAISCGPALTRRRRHDR